MPIKGISPSSPANPGGSPANPIDPDKFGKALGKVDMQSLNEKAQQAHNVSSNIQHKLDEMGQQLVQNLGGSSPEPGTIDPNAFGGVAQPADLSLNDPNGQSNPDGNIGFAQPDGSLSSPDFSQLSPEDLGAFIKPEDVNGSDSKEDGKGKSKLIPGWEDLFRDFLEKKHRRDAFLLAGMAAILLLGLGVAGVIVIPNLKGGSVSDGVGSPRVVLACLEACDPANSLCADGLSCERTTNASGEAGIFCTGVVCTAASSTQEEPTRESDIAQPRGDTPTPTVTVTVTMTPTTRVIAPTGPTTAPDACAAHGGTSYVGDTCVCPGFIDHVIICGDGTKFDNVTTQTCTPNESCAVGGTTGGGGSTGGDGAVDPTVACGCGLYGAPSTGMGCSNGVIEECNVATCGCKP